VHSTLAVHATARDVVEFGVHEGISSPRAAFSPPP
jgi:hypothetical protein